MSKAFEENGFKRKHVDNYNKTEWLFILNKYKFEYLWEILEHIPEFNKIILNNKIQVESATDRLRQAFKKCEKFGLPVRSFGKNRKNSKKKMGANVSGENK